MCNLPPTHIPGTCYPSPDAAGFGLTKLIEQATVKGEVAKPSWELPKDLGKLRFVPPVPHPRTIDVPVEDVNGPQIPEYKTPFAAGADLRAATSGYIPAGEVGLIPTGVKLAIPTGFEGQVRSRSGLAAKNHVFVLNSPGTVDSDYRGEIFVIMANLGPEGFTYNQGDRVAQLVIAQVLRGNFYLTDKLPTTERGEGGLGSTGR